jgi:hypothetical protein
MPIKALTDEQRELAGRNIEMAYAAAERLGRQFKRLKPDAVLALCLLGLVKGVATYDPARGRLSTWIDQECRRLLAETARSERDRLMGPLLEAAGIDPDDGDGRERLIAMLREAASGPREKSGAYNVERLHQRLRGDDATTG